ncbi:MAG TPA: hydroxyacylglutathione hydrolase [Burkholderiaceae bacterium]|nr:hydroxyacylglutathione hydrolase [Burkholderiaceae bacterium]
MELVALPAFDDNYIWMLHDGTRALVVDPGDEDPVNDALDARGLELAAILVTHHHGDHVGGIDALRARLRGPVFGPADERIPQPYTPLADGQVVEVLGVTFEVVRVPGHTAGHIAYASHPSDGRAALLFCGDTLFSAGCGRLFEGTPAQMHGSLTRLAALPDATRVCCAHEYTLSNLRFAAAVEPANADVEAHRIWCEAERAAGRPTLPSTIGRERRINPFLRVGEPGPRAQALARGAPADDPVSVLAALREWKNQFR